MKKLRFKIVIGVFLSATIVFLMTIFFFGLSAKVNIENRSDNITELIDNYNGQLPPFHIYNEMDEGERRRVFEYDAESPYRVRYCIVTYEDENVKEVDVTHIAAIDQDKAKEMADEVRNRRSSVGYYDNYRYRVCEKTGRVIFLDDTDDLKSLNTLLLMISVIAVFFVLMITVVFYFLSNRIVKPFEENAQMQKQFITDASHELKTPLAIISANAEVLAYKDGENEWLGNITSQVSRMSELINELLTLNRLEEIEEIRDIESVDLSVKLNAVSDSFGEVFNNKNVTVKRDIQPDVVINCNPAQIERLISVLVENAGKYVSENGEVIISLSKETRYTTLNVFNTCEIDKEVDYSHLFDRFYRPDDSRTSKTGGHGIGLSIAKRIVTLHGGSIAAVPSETGLSFNVKLSNKLKSKK